jgi:CMP-N-acetylneuraminic acid synthetase
MAVGSQRVLIEMKICIVPARGGSKRLPRKNMYIFQGKPMVQIALETAIATGVFDKVVLSSDDDEILNVGLKVPKVEIFRRDSNLSGDNVRADDVIRSISRDLNLSDDDIVCCLLPTTPLLDSKVLQKALDTYNGHGVLFGVSKNLQTPFRSFTMDQKGDLTPLFPSMLLKESNDYPETFSDAGQFYVAAKATWESNYSITATVGGVGFELALDRALDINTLSDWEILKRLHP